MESGLNENHPQPERADARTEKLREAGRLIAEAIQDALRDPWVLRHREGQLDMVARAMFTLATAHATGRLCDDSDDKRDFIAGTAIRDHGCVR